MLRCRTNRHRLSFAIQLCVLRAQGRFLPDYEALGMRITNHLCRQLNLPPVLFVNPPQREATDLEHEHRIRDYRGHASERKKLHAKAWQPNVEEGLRFRRRAGRRSETVENEASATEHGRNSR